VKQAEIEIPQKEVVHPPHWNITLALQIIAELRERRYRIFDVPDDLDMAWVLSGPGTVTTPPGDGFYADRLQDLERVYCGIQAIIIATAKWLNKKPHELTKADILQGRAILFYNGESQSLDIHPLIGKYPHIEDLLAWAQTSEFTLPFSHLVYSPIGIGNTPDQITNLANFLQENPYIRKIAVVTHLPHSRRVSRYLHHYNHLFSDRIQFIEYPVPEIPQFVGGVIGEIKRILRYSHKGDLASEPLY
jgi:hypothetical protein